MYTIYNILTILSIPFILPYLFYRAIKNPLYRKGLGQRIGFLHKELVDNIKDKKVFWVHAVSVGEVVAVSSLVRELRKRYPETTLLLSTVTETGNRTARQMLPEVDHLFYFPLDFCWMTRKIVSIIRPGLFIITETEIWPNILMEMKKIGVSVVMVNGRVSRFSFKKYSIVWPFIKEVLKNIDLFCMQTDYDAERIIRLGAPPERVKRTGNMKFDQQVLSLGKVEDYKKELGINSSAPILIAGSTHRGEEEYVVNAFQRLREKYPELVLVIAPRHPERSDEVLSLLNRKGIPFVRWTQRQEGRGAPAIIIDTIGVLSSLYSIATIVFTGGSLVQVGGHNILEPARWGKGILYGPYMDNFRELSDMFVSEGAAIQIKGPDELASTIARLLDNRDLLTEMGKRGLKIIGENQGATDRNIEFIAQLLR